MSIKLVQNIEHVRLRPGMYIRNTGKEGFLQLLSEIVDNSIDEVVNGYANQITIIVEEDLSFFSVEDNGRGIPFHQHPDTGLSTLETVATFLGSGGKFDHEDYNFSSGLHGVGLVVVNALSYQMEIVSKREGKKAKIIFERGKKKNFKVQILSKTTTGTRVSFSPDFSFFEEIPTLKEIEEEVIKKTVPLLIPIILKIRKDGKIIKKEKLKSSLEDWVSPSLSFEGGNWKVVLDWKNPSPVSHIWFNGVYTSGGRPQSLIKQTLRKVFGVKVDPSIFSIGAIFWGRDPVFASQAKTFVQKWNKEEEKIFQQEFFDKLSLWVAQHPRLPFISSSENSSASSVDLSLPEKLVVASVPPSKRELYIVEGDSAAGTAKAARFPFQEILPLRGKIPNVLSSSKFLSNQEIQAILAAANPERVSKVFLLADPDPDGKHIETLIITLLAFHLPDLLKQNKLFVVKSPLLVATYKHKRIFANTLEELKEKGVTKLWTVSYLKGHGESSKEEIRYYAMDPATRDVQSVPWSEDLLSSLKKVMNPSSSFRHQLVDIVRL